MEVYPYYNCPRYGFNISNLSKVGTATVPLEDQVCLWRDYMITEAPLVFYRATLISEDKNLKIYVEDEHDVFYTPFTSHFCTHAGHYEHFTHVKGESYVKEYKDYVNDPAKAQLALAVNNITTRI